MGEAVPVLEVAEPIDEHVPLTTSIDEPEHRARDVRRVRVAHALVAVAGKYLFDVDEGVLAVDRPRQWLTFKMQNAVFETDARVVDDEGRRAWQSARRPAHRR